MVFSKRRIYKVSVQMIPLDGFFKKRFNVSVQMIEARNLSLIVLQSYFTGKRRLFGRKVSSYIIA